MKQWKRGFFAFLQMRESITIIILGGYLLMLVIFSPIFFRVRNLQGLAIAAAVEVPVVIGMHALLATGNFDLSVGSVAAFAGMAVAFVLRSTGNIPLALGVGFAIGILFGLLNGLLVARVKLNAFVATLAMMGIARSMALGFFEGRALTGFPDAFRWLGQNRVLDIVIGVWIALVIAIVADFSFRKIKHLRRLYYIGSSTQAATYCGISVPRTVLSGFLISGIGAAYTGISMTSRAMAASPLIFRDLPLDAITACVIGGSSILGGEGSVVGAIIGLFIVMATRNIMLLLGVSVYWRSLVIGVILIIAVTTDAYMRSKETELI